MNSIFFSRKRIKRFLALFIVTIITISQLQIPSVAQLVKARCELPPVTEEYKFLRLEFLRDYNSREPQFVGLASRFENTPWASDV